MSEFDDAVQIVLVHEGSTFTNNPNDPGGATKYGVTLYSLKFSGLYDPDGSLFGDVNHDGRIDIQDVQGLTKDTAVAYYRAKWWDYYKFGDIKSQSLATKVFDTAVNMGGVPAIKILQKAANLHGSNLVVDGNMGPKTLLAINSLDAAVMLIDCRVSQVDRYLQLIIANSKLSEFRLGWLRRAVS